MGWLNYEEPWELRQSDRWEDFDEREAMKESKVNEAQNTHIPSSGLQKTSELKTAPSKVSFALDSEQLAAVASLYEGRTIADNGGRMFGVLGEAFIDDRLDRYGTATFRWLTDEQYTKIRAAIRDALATNTDASSGTA